ncbi:RNA polymerase sigma factor [Bacteroides finegoldii]|uniref:RNA polymerase sigma factor n=1 Tax=Bacteroides finegoldii TaxID=338188 RepID=UPI00234D19DE|nr:RNA polymerase sigma-70 factor [Bacteroides finegoldii]MDC7141164.1 RNA polymerase sigma-70 factor [Bacteroides finegoldii]
MIEKEYIKLLKNGNKDAFSVLYEKYWRKVYSFSKLYLKNEFLLDDIVQEVFLKLWESKEFIGDNNTIEGLLFIITRNMIFNQYRRKINEDFYKTTVLYAFEHESYSVEDEVTAYDLKEYIDSFIEKMPPRRKVIFNMSRKDNLTYKQIAEQLNISEKTVENQIHKAIYFLKQNIIILVFFYI